VRLLLDTHVLLWWINDDPRLSSRSRGLISGAHNTVAVSVATIWEIAIKAGLGQLEAPPDLRGYLQRQLARNRFELRPVLFEHAICRPATAIRLIACSSRRAGSSAWL